MIVYIFLALSPVLLGLFFPQINTSRKQKYIYFFLCGLIMLTFMGLRDKGLGSGDSLHYYQTMERALESSTWLDFYDPELYEAGYQMFVFLLSRIVHHPQWIFVASSLIYIVSLFFFVNKNSDDIPLSITLYVSLGLMTFQMQGMRQAIAMSICLFAFEFAKQRKLIRFILLVSFAAMFHSTAIVFFAVYWLATLKMKRRNILLVAVLSAIGVSLSNILVEIGNQIFDKDYSGVFTSGGAIATAIYVITVAVAVMYLYYFENHNKDVYFLLLIIIVATAIYIMRYVGVQIAERVSFYLTFPQIVLLPLVGKMFVKQEKAIVNMIIAALAVGLFAYRLQGSEFLPYAFFG